MKSTSWQDCNLWENNAVEFFDLTGVRQCVPNASRAQPHQRGSFRESSSGLLKFIVYQMIYEFRRLFVLGFGDVDSAQDRKEH
jgi:hypothetical protein